MQRAPTRPVWANTRPVWAGTAPIPAQLRGPNGTGQPQPSLGAVLGTLWPGWALPAGHQGTWTASTAQAGSIPFALPKLPFPSAAGRSSATLLRLFWGSHAGIGAGIISCCPALGANLGADAQPGRRGWCRGRCPQDPTAGSPGDFTETLLGIFQALLPEIQRKSLKYFFLLIQVKPKQSHVPAKITMYSLNFPP